MDMFVLEHYVLATELWVHVSRLPMLHLDKTDGNTVLCGWAIWSLSQYPMETLLCLTFLSFHHYPHQHMSFHTSQNCQHIGRTCWPFCVDGLFGARYNILEGCAGFHAWWSVWNQHISPCKINNKSNKFWQWKQIKNKFLGLEIIRVHVSRLAVPHLDKTDGNILYLTLFLLMGGDATQFVSFFVVNHFLTLLTIPVHFRIIRFFFLVNLSCLMFAHHRHVHACWWCFIPFHSLSIILTLHCADGGVGNSSSLSYTPSSAHAISSHSSTHCISVTNSFICIKFPAPQNYQYWTPGVFWFTSYYIIISL